MIIYIGNVKIMDEMQDILPLDDVRWISQYYDHFNAVYFSL